VGLAAKIARRRNKMSVDPKTVRGGQHYAAGRQIREVVEVVIKTVERLPPKRKNVLNRKRIKNRVKRVRYKSRGHKVSMPYGNLVWVDLEKFARDVDRLVDRNYDPDYPWPPQT
jgi:hypothetical protein